MTVIHVNYHYARFRNAAVPGETCEMDPPRSEVVGTGDKCRKWRRHNSSTLISIIRHYFTTTFEIEQHIFVLEMNIHTETIKKLFKRRSATR